MSYDYATHFAESAKVYVDKHKDEDGWIEKMISYYLNPNHPCRVHEYTKFVLNILLAEKALRSNNE